MKTGAKAKASSFTKISNKILDENVNIQRVKKYFTSEAWADLISTIKEHPEWTCFRGKEKLSDQDSMACYCCLYW